MLDDGEGRLGATRAATTSRQPQRRGRGPVPAAVQLLRQRGRAAGLEGHRCPGAIVRRAARAPADASSRGPSRARGTPRQTCSRPQQQRAPRVSPVTLPSGDPLTAAAAARLPRRGPPGDAGRPPSRAGLQRRRGGPEPRHCAHALLGEVLQEGASGGRGSEDALDALSARRGRGGALGLDAAAAAGEGQA